MKFATFIIPTTGRSTLPHALKSIINQTDGDWNAVVVGDGLQGDWIHEWQHPNILYCNLSEKKGQHNHGGIVRDHGMANASGKWLCFLDDDDSLHCDYVKWLKEESLDMDIVVFKMKMPDGALLPPSSVLFEGGVGISFAIRRTFQHTVNLWFPAGQFEDWIFLKTAMMAGARVKLSANVAYYVRQ